MTEASQGVSINEFARNFVALSTELGMFTMRLLTSSALQLEIQIELAANVMQNKLWDDLALKAADYRELGRLILFSYAIRT